MPTNDFLLYVVMLVLGNGSQSFIEKIILWEDCNTHQIIKLGRTNKKKKINSCVSVVFLYGIPWRRHFGESKGFNPFCNLLMNKKMEIDCLHFQLLLFSKLRDTCIREAVYHTESFLTANLTCG